MRRTGVLVFLCSGVLLLTGCQKSAPSQPSTAPIIVHGYTVNAEVVSSQAALTQGLSGRENLPTDGGMLFIFFQSQPHPFWMKDMRFPLDIIWLSKGQVVDIWANAPATPSGQPPARRQPQISADMVLEVAAGSIDTWSLRVGDTVVLPSALDLKAVAR